MMHKWILVPWLMTGLCSLTVIVALMVRFWASAFFLPAYLFVIGLIAFPVGIVAGVVGALVVPRAEEEGRMQPAWRVGLTGATSAAAVAAVVLPFVEHPA